MRLLFGVRCGRGLLVLGLALVAGLGTAEAKAPKTLDIADAINANRILTKFAALVQAADMGTFLSSRGPFTVFVPTDSAFSRLPPGTVESLMRPENKETLQKIVLFHIFSGKPNYAKDLLTIPSLPSCEGQPLVVKKSRSGSQLVQKAKIIRSDMHCFNGVIHEIDTLLVPPDVPLPPVVAMPAPAPVVPPSSVTVPDPIIPAPGAQSLRPLAPPSSASPD